MIKLIAIDLDGTLLDDNKNISIENKKAIKLAKEKGIRVVIASGRPINGILPILNELELNSNNDYCIAYNGGKIFNVGTGEIIHSTTISGKDCRDLYYESRRLGVHFHAFRENEELITVDKNPYTDIEARINFIEDHIFDFTKIKDDESFIKAMLVDSKENIDRCMLKVDSRFKSDFQMMRSSEIFLEFLNPLTNKGLAIKTLCSYLNIDMSSSMAIGDAGNDAPMIKEAAIGVCMSNATESLRKEFKLITDDNNNSGVAKAIIKYAL